MANFKVFCHNGEVTEAKRFFVDADVVTSFVFMKEKLVDVFPILRNNEFKITWKDSEGDDILITNDEDFMTAMTELTEETPKNLHVTIGKAKSEEFKEASEPKLRIVCDVCNNSISGFRYKCLECPDYDLCATCENVGNHSMHICLRLPTPDIPMNRYDSKMMFQAAKALKRTAYHATKEAHRCTKDFLKHAYKSERWHKSGDNKQGDRPSASSSETGCPFGLGLGEPIKDIINQNIQNLHPILEALNKKPANAQEEQESQNLLGDVVRNAVSAFFGVVQGAGASSVPQTPPSTPGGVNTPTTSKDAASKEEEAKATASKEEEAKSAEKTTPAPAEPQSLYSSLLAPAQEMDWTIVQPTEATTAENIPKPPQDLRLMKGLAQLHEMGFSNENGFLKYLLEKNDFDVSKVVKAILEMN